MSVDCMNVRPGVEVASLTDVGCQRENNEDSYLYWEPASDEEFQRKGRLAAIADGMGGHEGGQEASRLAVETVREVYDQALDDDPQAALVGALIRSPHTNSELRRALSRIPGNGNHVHRLGSPRAAALFCARRGQPPVPDSRLRASCV